MTPELDAIIDRHRDRPGALLPLLHDIQHAIGYVPPESIPDIAAALNLSQAETHGVITFYTDFRTTPPARTVVKFCMAEACQARGAEAAAEQLCGALKLSMGETSADGRVSLEPAYCLGLCASGPAALVDERPLARLEGARLDRLIATVRA